MRRKFRILYIVIVALTLSLCSVYISNSETIFFSSSAIKALPILRPNPVLYGKFSNFSKDPLFDSNLAIVEVITEGKKTDAYRTAIGSVQCYAAMKGHYMYLLDMEHYKPYCGHHKDFYYRRHCVIGHLMDTRQHDWYVFLDSDMEVVNEKRSFSEFIDSKHDVLLYDRFWNWEIMAGSYIVKGSDFGKKFVKGFANFEFQHPKHKHHGTDNGGIQAYVAELVFNGRSEIEDCWKIWEKSKGWDDIFVHEWCVRKHLGAEIDKGKIKVFKKGTAWARDGELTGGKWSKDFDFILHGRKESKKKPYDPKKKEYWYDVRYKPLDLNDCTAGNATWFNRADMMISKKGVEEHLIRRAKGIESYLKSVFKRTNRTIDLDGPFIKDIVQRFSVYTPRP
ncbi:unnamed protein product [Auanema sp. JU1783]|nr:unnamed protein product [Auanema sp. JU1783]